MRLATQVAYEIIDMDRRIQYLEAENAQLQEYKKKYNKLLDDSISHSETMMGDLINATVKERI